MNEQNSPIFRQLYSTFFAFDIELIKLSSKEGYSDMQRFDIGLPDVKIIVGFLSFPV